MKKNIKVACTGAGCPCHKGGICRTALKVDKFFNQSTDEYVLGMIKKGKEHGWEAETTLEMIEAGMVIRKLLKKTKK